jgi:putative radical SAM enzyme (TIGR03279 family)
LTAGKEDLRRISGVTENSIADELGIVPGDILLSIDDREVIDVFDYRMRMAVEELKVTFLLADGTYLEAFVEKDEDEDLGLSFEEPLLDSCSSCKNKCVFCFIDQLPKGMRKTLYFKDDDLRMSFLTGNYVTLTNLSESEFERILSYHLSPMNVSVHATDPEVRIRIMRNPNAQDIMHRLRRIIESGISLNCQIVLCPGINDGAILERTLTDLSSLGPQLLSIAVVPVGITKFREENKLFPLKPFDRETASGVLKTVNRWQRFFLKTRGQRIFFSADEFYLRAGARIPSSQAYEGFPQLENGVGMISDFKREMRRGLLKRSRKVETNSTNIDRPVQRIFVLTGVDAANTLNLFAERISLLYNVTLEVHAVRNRFFGDLITVSGLLTGSDLVSAMEELREKGNGSPDLVMIADCMLKSDEDIFLDDMTLKQFEKSIKVPVHVCSASGAGLLDALDTITNRFSKAGSQEPQKGRRIHE